MTDQVKRLLIVGGGISGLSAAYYAWKHSLNQNVKLEITLVEKSKTLGGKIQTLHRDGFIIERGPDSFLARKTPIIELTKELGLEGELTATNPAAKKTYILNKKRFHRIPPGLILGIPTKILPFIRTSLISPLGKARAALDIILPARKDQTDESLGSFLERRLGSEVLNNIAEPLLAGIYAGDTHTLSLQSTFPQFQQLENKYRSLIIGMVQSRKRTASTVQLPDPIKDSMFLTYKKGLKTLVDALIDRLESVELITEINVEAISKSGSEYEVTFSNGVAWKGEAIILAIPSYQAGKLLNKLSSSETLDQLPYVSVANIIMAYEASEIVHPLDGTGFVVPKTEGRFITACTWTSSKWLHTSPSDKILLRCYMGRSGQEDWIHLSDEEIENKVRLEIKEIMGIEAKPLFVEVTRWRNSMPQYAVGHLERIRNVRNHVSRDYPGIRLTGSSYEGVGLPDCIQQGKEASKQTLEYLFPPFENL